MSDDQAAVPEAVPAAVPERRSVLTLPNVLTSMRLVLLPIIVAGIATNHGWLAVIAMFLGILTDLADGRLARRLRGGATAFGKSLDGTVDFVLIYSLFISLYVAGHLATWQFAVLYVQMLSILILQIVMTGTGQAEGIVQTPLGKPVGALQYLFLLFLMAMLVIPPNRAVDIVEFYYFVVLTVAIALNTLECLTRLRRML
jgi:cardiolipin synthase (CMP-forming)